MARQKLTHRLAEVRVSEELFYKVHQVAEAQGVDIADVQRLALEDYTSPPDNIVQIMGVIKDGQVIFDTPPFLPVPGAKVLSRYLNVEPVGGA
jgi:hypothetical protein